MIAACPLCEGPSRRLFQAHGIWIRDCERCRHRFAEHDAGDDHVDRIYADDYYQGGGAGYPDYLAEERSLTDRGRWYGRLLKRYMEPGTVLDVGAAAGFLLKGLIDSGWTGSGVEPNARMAAHAREHLGLSVETGTIEGLRTAGDPLGRVATERFDLVSMIQVVAHFPDPRRAFEAAAALTRPGGFWLIETWNRESWTARCFGRRWHEYSPPSVLHWFSPDSLRDLGESFGFREIARGRPLKRISGRHATSLLRYKLQGSRPGRLAARILLGSVPESLSLPYPFDDLFWMLLRAGDGPP